MSKFPTLTFAEQSVRFAKQFKYNLKRALPAFIIAGAGMMAQSCSDKDDDPTPTHDVELKWSIDDYGTHADAIESIDNIRAYAADKSVANIYLTLDDSNNFSRFGTQNLSNVHSYLEERTSVSPKVHGRGDFNIPFGRINKEDSLWLVKNGWTVNQRKLNQSQR